MDRGSLRPLPAAANQKPQEGRGRRGRAGQPVDVGNEHLEVRVDPPSPRLLGTKVYVLTEPHAFGDASTLLGGRLARQQLTPTGKHPKSRLL